MRSLRVVSIAAAAAGVAVGIIAAWTCYARRKDARPPSRARRDCENKRRDGGNSNTLSDGGETEEEKQGEDVAPNDHPNINAADDDGDNEDTDTTTDLEAESAGPPPFDDGTSGIVDQERMALISDILRSWCREGRRSGPVPNIPMHPEFIYRLPEFGSGWQGWSHFLGLQQSANPEAFQENLKQDDLEDEAFEKYQSLGAPQDWWDTRGSDDHDEDDDGDDTDDYDDVQRFRGPPVSDNNVGSPSAPSA